MGPVPSPDAYARALGAGFVSLPSALKHLHSGSGVWTGEITVQTGGVFARMLGRLAGFPPASDRVPFRLTVRARDDRYIWDRHINGRTTRSVQWYDAARNAVFERLGPVTMQLDISYRQNRVHVGTRAGWVLGLPLPKGLVPVSRSSEFQDAQGRFCFDIAADLPGLGRIIRYHGWLVPDGPFPVGAET